MSHRIVFVHAHPDDESSKGAATAARYVDEGHHVVLVTLTGGEAGDVLNPNAPPVELEDMPAVRRAELEAAAEVIGFSARYELGFRDSGYHEDPTGLAESCFARTPVDEAAAPLAEVIRKERPHVVVTYPEDGGYPHPDHIMCYEVTVRALELAEDPGARIAGEPWRTPKVYACHAFPPDRVRALHDAIVDRGEESPFEGWMERRADRRDWPCDALVDVGDWLERRDRALLSHVSQVDPNGTWFSWPRAIEREVYPWECFTRLRADVEVDGVEDDLFTGLEDETRG